MQDKKEDWEEEYWGRDPEWGVVINILAVLASFVLCGLAAMGIYYGVSAIIRIIP